MTRRPGPGCAAGQAAARRLALLGLLLGGAACAESDDTPVGAVRQLVQAVENLEAERVYALLAPQTQRQLAALVARANKQTGAGRRFGAQDMLLLGLGQPQLELSRVELQDQDEQRATVRLVNEKRKQQETLQLLRVKGRWRVALDFSR